jgi:hypothetical protein
MGKVLDRPSSLMTEIRLEKVGEWNLFKFSNTLQQRMEDLLDKQKIQPLTPDEAQEWEAIAELARIFTHINAVIAAEHGNH